MRHFDEVRDGDEFVRVRWRGNARLACSLDYAHLEYLNTVGIPYEVVGGGPKLVIIQWLQVTEYCRKERGW